MSESSSVSESLPWDPLARLRASRDNGDFADVTFIVGDDGNQQHFPAIKALFANASPIFAAMLYGSGVMAEARTSEVRIIDMSPTTFVHVLEHVYFETEDDFMSTTQVEHIMGVILASDKYQLLELRRLCVELIGRHCVDNVTPYLETAVREDFLEGLDQCSLHVQRAIVCKAFLREEGRAAAELMGNRDEYESDEDWASPRDDSISSRGFRDNALSFIEGMECHFAEAAPQSTAYICGARHVLGQLVNNQCVLILLAKDTPGFIEKLIEYYAMLAQVGVHRSDERQHVISDELLYSNRFRLAGGEQGHGVFAFLAARNSNRTTSKPRKDEVGRCVVMLCPGLLGGKGVIATKAVQGKAKGKAKGKGADNVLYTVMGLRDPSDMDSVFLVEAHIDDLFLTRFRSPSLPVSGSDFLGVLQTWAARDTDHWLFTPFVYPLGADEVHYSAY